MSTVFHNFWRDKHGSVVLAQKPNAPLLIWLVATIATHFVHGQIRVWLQGLALLAIVVWALLEIFWGRSGFRRTLGVVILIVVIYNRLGN